MVNEETIKKQEKDIQIEKQQETSDVIKNNRRRKMSAPRDCECNLDYLEELEQIIVGVGAGKPKKLFRKNYIFIYSKDKEVGNIRGDSKGDILIGNLFTSLREQGVVEFEKEKFVDFSFNSIFKGKVVSNEYASLAKKEKGGLLVIRMPFEYDVVYRNAQQDYRNPVNHEGVDLTLYDSKKAIKCEVDNIVDIVKNNNGDQVIVFVFDSKLSYMKNRLFDKELKDVQFKVINFDEIYTKKVTEYFHYRLREDRLMDDFLVSLADLMKLYQETGECRFNVTNRRLIDRIYESWKNEYQYKKGNIDEKTYNVFKKIHKTGFEKLNELCGQEDIKNKIKNICDSYNIQRLRKEKSLETIDVNKHMILTGNPGTGKTTMARIIAQIFYENGIIENEQITEVGKEDIISKWIGETEEVTKAKIEDSIGGLLFIDEAYAISQDEKNGKHIMSILVREMENNRDKLTVAFAGYEKEMEEFLKVNTGLESRIGLKAHFNDFTAKELVEIAKLYAKSKDYKITIEAEKRLEEIFKDAVSKNEDCFGNARYARNVVENSITNQASRLLEYKNPTIDELMSLKPLDF